MEKINNIKQLEAEYEKINKINLYQMDMKK